ncbi:class I SAM-dependent methyltransferase [Bradyrhizobium sp. Ash2021]|uniref:class I SAM-dependent methyltransferase n=1 Tax=Bradyrhizobium sp. Ash2021 TaxID=2954771 RepID=UPI002814C9D7|nr:class I SAM-dependent methyltransferase [Bradyrhizobium sp. Ash2021]WMT76951.1 class I SAM-dependent methyltransferase [Bradyrhizobium sp. Ash2021]
MSKSDPPLPLYDDPSIRQRFDIAARKIQRQFWDNQAVVWDAERASHGLRPHHIERMATWLTDPVLLVGAGRGMMLQALRTKGYAATGVDWSANMVAEAQREGTFGLSRADAGHLPYDDQSVATVILSTGVLLPTHTQERRDAYFSEAWRILVPTGRLILCLWFEEGSAKAQWAAENVKLPIHTLQAHVHWDLGPLAASLSRQGFDTLDKIKYDDVLIWGAAKTTSLFQDEFAPSISDPSSKLR